MTTLESGGRVEHEDQTLAALGQLNAQRRREGAVKPEAEAEVVLESMQVEFGPGRRNLPGVVEECHVEIAVDHDAPLRLQQQRVAIVKTPAAVTAQRRTAPERGQH